MAAVDIGVAHQDDLVVADLGDVELLSDAGPDGRDEGLDLVVLEHPIHAGPLDVEDLAPDRENRLHPGVARLGGRPAGRVALDDEQFAFIGITAAAVLQLLGHARALERRLASGGVAGRASGDAGVGGLGCFGHQLLGLVRVLLQPVGQPIVGGALDE